MNKKNKIDTKRHLCLSCRYTYPECQSKRGDVKFGDGYGNDNIYECNKYEPAKELRRMRKLATHLKKKRWNDPVDPIGDMNRFWDECQLDEINVRHKIFSTIVSSDHFKKYIPEKERGIYMLMLGSALREVHIDENGDVMFLHQYLFDLYNECNGEK